MSKKLYLFVVLLLLGTFVLAACGGSEPEAADTTTDTSAETTTDEAVAEPAEETKEEMADEAMGMTGKIVLWHALTEAEADAMIEILAGFQAANPDVEFEVLFKPFDNLRASFETAAGTGSGPTVLIGAADWGPAFYDAGLIADVGNMIGGDTVANINPAALGAVQYRNALIGLPYVIKGVVPFRNVTLVPDAPTTFAEVQALGDLYDLERGFFFSAGTLSAQGGQLMTATGDPLFNDEAGVAWLNALAAFNDDEYYGETDVDLFKAGELGYIVDGTWNITNLAEAIGAENLAIDPWPAGLSGYVQTDNVYLSANVAGDDATASAGLMEYLLSAEAQAKLTNIPARTGVEISDPLNAQAAKAFETGVAFPVIPEMGAFWGPMDALLNAVYEEGTDPAAALASAFADVSAGIADIRGEAPPTPVPAEESSDDAMMEDLTGTVTLWHALTEGEADAMIEILAGFQAIYPNVEFELLFKPFDNLRSSFETSAGTGSGPTVLIGAADWGPAFYDAGLVADISAMVSGSTVSAINPAALGAVRYDGALVGLPYVIKGVVPFRNVSLVPDAPTTFEEVQALGDLYDLERGFFFSAATLTAQGGELMTADGDPLFNTEAGVAWLNALAAFNDDEYYGETDVDLFKAGELGYIIDGTWNIGNLADAIGAENLAIDPWPAGLSGYVQTDNVYLSANAEEGDAKAGAAFIEYLLSAEAQAKLVNIPARTGVEISDPLNAQAAKAFETGVAFPVIPEMGAFWGPMDALLNAVYEEGTDPATALQTAFDDVTAGVTDIRGE